MKFLVTTIFVAIATAACSTTETSAPKADNVACSQERPTGSNIAFTRCRTHEQAEREREGATNLLTAPHQASPGTR